LSFGNDGFSDCESLADHHVLFHAATSYDVPLFHSFVRLDNVHKRAGLTGLDGLVGDHHGVLLRGQTQDNSHKLAGP
jgi:hypothetical protein